jgi:hypothetical protein
LTAAAAVAVTEKSRQVDAVSYYTVVEHCMRWIVIVAILIAATDQSMKEYVLHTQKERRFTCRVVAE